MYSMIAIDIGSLLRPLCIGPDGGLINGTSLFNSSTAQRKTAVW